MNAADTLALLPLILIAAAAVIVMLGIAYKRSHALAAALTLVGLAAAFISVDAAVPLAPRQVTSLLFVDRYALFYIGLIIFSAAAWPLIIILVVTSVAGLFYYLRVVVALYSAQPEHVAGQVVSTRQEADGSGVFMLAVLAILLIWFGVYPTPLLHLIRITMASFN